MTKKQHSNDSQSTLVVDVCGKCSLLTAITQKLLKHPVLSLGVSGG